MINSKVEYLPPIKGNEGTLLASLAELPLNSLYKSQGLDKIGTSGFVPASGFTVRRIEKVSQANQVGNENLKIQR